MVFSFPVTTPSPQILWKPDVYVACHRLAAHPDVGHFRRDLTNSEVRFFNIRRKFLIVYDPTTDPLQILRILRGERDTKAELKKDPGSD